MSTSADPKNAIEEEEEENDDNEDFGSEDDSQVGSTRSGSENTEEEQEDEEEPEENTVIENEGESEEEEYQEQSEQEEEKEPEKEDYQDESIEQEEMDEIPPLQRPERRSIPRGMFYRQQQQQQQQQRYRQEQQRQRRRWISPQRSKPRLRDQRTRDSYGNDKYMNDQLSFRLHLTQAETLKEELSGAIQESIAKSDFITQMEQKLKKAEIENAHLQRINMITEKKLESLQKTLNDNTRQYDSTNQELTSAKAEIESLKKSVKEGNISNHILEKKLSQANNEIENTKKELSKFRQISKEQEENYKKRIEEMIKEKKTMERQNMEMHKVIKKHMQLISNLRRQVLHIKAAAALRLSEDEFLRALERNS